MLLRKDPNTIKSAYYLLFFLLISFSACKDEDEFPEGYDHPCDHMLGSYAMLPSSISKIPFAGKQVAVYKDTLGNEIALDIVEVSLTDKQAIVLNWPDMTMMYLCYESQPELYQLQFDSLGVIINARYQAVVHGADPASATVADEALIGLQVASQNYYKVFLKVVEQRSYGEDDYNTRIDSFTCFCNTYLDVEHELVIFGPPAIFYNDTEGVVRFIDPTGKAWCFDHFE